MSDSLKRSKIFISQPMRDKTEDEICATWNRVLKVFPKERYEYLEAYFKDFDGSSLAFLGKSIMDGLSKADIAVFCSDWERYDNCRCEHFIAAQYKIKCVYIR
jgi:hypothetical protein